MKDFTSVKIVRFEIHSYNNITIYLSDNSSYSANLQSFNEVYCYPKNFIEWQKASIGEFKSDIEWESGFGVHLDQIASLSENEDQSA